MAIERTGAERMDDISSKFMRSVSEIPGFKDWQRRNMDRTLNFDDLWFSSATDTNPSMFEFNEDVEKQHKVLMNYLQLRSSVESLKGCEFYFRRYPFNGLPVSKYEHLRNVCEMYFSCFYKVKERLKKLLNSANALSDKHLIDIGELLIMFQGRFSRELKHRNIVHHHGDFDDLEIDRIFIFERVVEPAYQQSKNSFASTEYRRVSKEWAIRVKESARSVEVFVEVVSNVIANNLTDELTLKL